MSSRRRSSLSAEREANRERVLALVPERPSITNAELTHVAGLSSAGVAQNLRRMLDRREVCEEVLPGGRLATESLMDRPAQTASVRDGRSGS